MRTMRWKTFPKGQETTQNRHKMTIIHDTQRDKETQNKLVNNDQKE